MSGDSEETFGPVIIEDHEEDGKGVARELRDCTYWLGRNGDCFKKQGVASVWKCRKASSKIRSENFQAVGVEVQRWTRNGLFL